MRSSAVKKQEDQSYTGGYAGSKPVELRRHIALVAEEAASLPGNQNDTDFEAFLSKYGIKSDFA